MLLACDGAGETLSPGSAYAAAPADHELYRMTEAERLAVYARLERAALASERATRAIALALSAARVARARMRFGDTPAALPPVRSLLRRVFEHHSVAASCRVALELASLEASAADDLAEARRWAQRAHERASAGAGAEICRADAARVRETLGELGGAHAGEPSAVVVAGRGHATESVEESAVASFVSRRGEPPARVRLEEIAVYGAKAHGDRASSGRDVRVVLRFGGPAVYRSRELAATADLPRRLSLDLDEVVVSKGVADAIAVEAGGLQRIRHFGWSPGRHRVSFDLGAQTAYRLFFLDAPYRIVIDFRDASAAAAARTRGGPVVVIDPGHGGEQPGAKGPNGLKESVVALSLARRVRAALERRRPDLGVVLTRDEDRFLTLEERTAIANGYGADLFVSIHLNASSSAEDKGGVSTFVLDTTDDQAAMRLAARENGTDADGVSELQLILASLYRADQVGHSLDLAKKVHHATLSGGRRVLPMLHDRGVKRALFYVLVGATMPAILVEASFITRPEEAEALQTDAYRDALAEGMAAGIDRYLARSRR